MRTLVIGDVHGCIDELDALLDRLRADPDADRIVFVGDLVNKGPDSPAVYARFQELKAEAILGNHELRLLEQADRPRERDRSYAALEQAFGPKAWREFVKDIRGWPSFLDSPGWLVVHAGLVPGVAPADTPPEILANIRTWDGTGRDLQAGDNPPWFEFYRDGQLVVFGHWAALGGVVRDNVIGLDTGCVYGYRLSALVLPERAICSVAAERAYCPVVASSNRSISQP